MATTSFDSEETAWRWMISGARLSGPALSTEEISADIFLVRAVRALTQVVSGCAAFIFRLSFSFAFAAFAVTLVLTFTVFAGRACYATGEGLRHLLAVPI